MALMEGVNMEEGKGKGREGKKETGKTSHAAHADGLCVCSRMGSASTLRPLWVGGGWSKQGPSAAGHLA